VPRLGVALGCLRYLFVIVGEHRLYVPRVDPQFTHDITVPPVYF
jgi:hypothetical protein